MNGNKEKPMKDLGDQNSWYFVPAGEKPQIPKIVTNCRKLGHELNEVTVGRCLTRVTCPICGYTYLVDSSD